MKKTTDFGFKQVDSNEKQKLVNEVFDSVANRYDLMNDLMSCGVHRLWKRLAISHCQIRPQHHVLDVATGSGDLACLIAPRLSQQGSLTLSDINANMLQLAKNRLIDKGYIQNIDFAQANAECLPFKDNTFDRVIISFGLRNVTHKAHALQSFYRVLKPGGRLIVLEFSHTTIPGLSHLYDAYSFHILPLIGKWVANDSESYRYLAESIRMHPDQEILKALMLEAGFDSCEHHNLTGGIVAIHKGLKY